MVVKDLVLVHLMVLEVVEVLEQVGGNATSTLAGNGGDGTASSITGSSVTRAGGGGGSSDIAIGPHATGGAGGGGAGNKSSPATAGTVNTGSGGGGGRCCRFRCWRKRSCYIKYA
jgi:hypothetical protein